MKKNRLLQIVALLLSVFTVFGMFSITAAGTESSEGSGSSGTSYNWDQIKDILNAVSYTSYISRYDDVAKGESDVVIDVINDFLPEKSDVSSVETLKSYAVSKGLTDLLNFADSDKAAYIPDTGKMSWKVNLPADGLYGIRIVYVPISKNVSSIERILYINDEIPFSEARSLSMSKTWAYDYKKADGVPYFDTDVNGNDLRASVGMASPEWYTYDCSDSNGYTIAPFEFYFRAGENVISLSASREDCAISKIILYRLEDAPSLEDYVKSCESKYDAKKVSSSAVIKIEAEYPDAVSDTSIYAANDRSSSITTSNMYNKETGKAENNKNSPSAQLLNTIGANSYDTVGQWAAYKFTVSESGFYNIVMRYKQTALQGMFISRVIKIKGYGYGDGNTPTVPFKEAYYARFNYAKNWQTSAVGDGTDTFEFYFKEGEEYTLYLEVGLGSLCEIISTVENTVTKINDAYLKILQLTGPTPDEYRSYNFTKILRSTVRSLLECSKTLTEVSDSIKEICGTTGSHVVTLDNVARLLKTMGEDPEDEIAPNLATLKSYVGTLGTWINSSKAQAMTVDYISVQSEDAKLPKANANFFQAAWFEISAFFKSFKVDYNSMGVTNADDCDTTLNVWLAYGRDQSLIWRNLINDNFTPNTNIAVNLKLVAAGTLLPSVLSGAGPDAYIGLDSASTINYAIRGAVASLNQFEDTSKLLDGSTFKEAALIPISLYGELYGLPETMAFNMMFVRLDVLAGLEQDVPKTWDDLLSINTVLQSNNMEIGVTYTTAIQMMIYQRGGSIWEYEEEGGIYAGSQIAYGDDMQLEVFTFVSRLYTDYSFPLTFDANNRFRTGEMPIVIGDYVSIYNTLTVFATEIKGKWNFMSVPGTKRADGTIDRQSTATVTATIMLHGSENPKEAWEFIKWQTSAKMQAQYGNEMVALIGPSAKYATANIQAIKDLSWSANEYASIVEQLDAIAAVANYPGNYILARYIEFAFMNAYNNGEDPAYAMKSYINTINKEINRKRQEFNLPIIEIGSTLEKTLAD